MVSTATGEHHRSCARVPGPGHAAHAVRTPDGDKLSAGGGVVCVCVVPNRKLNQGSGEYCQQTAERPESQLRLDAAI